MGILTEANLKAFLPKRRELALWAQILNDAMERFDINTRERAAAFLAQIAHESNELRHLVENLNYTARRLMKVFPKRFPTLDKAINYERQPEKLANYVYANRLGNGDEASGDGWRFRGRGLIQVTGRGNYRSAGIALKLPLETEPELIEKPSAAALSAAHFWKSRGLNELADDKNDDNDDADFVAISGIINRSREGLTSRRNYWDRAKKALA